VFKKILILFTCIAYFGVGQLYAQSDFLYSGGNGASYDTTQISKKTCETLLNYNLLFYAGGTGGNYDTTQISKNNCVFTPLVELILYNGGTGVTYDTAQISKNNCIFTPLLELILYSGGTGVTYDTAQISKSTCIFSPISELIIYSGGTGGTYDTAQINNKACVFPSGNNIYKGSNVSVGSTMNLNNLTTGNNLSGPYITTIRDTSIIKGECVTLTTTGVGATSYLWTQSIGSDLSSTTIQNPIAKPTETTIYTITASGTTPGCNNISTVKVSVIDNGDTRLNYPSSVCNTAITNQFQYPLLTGITNGTFTISPAIGMIIDAKTGAIKTYNATVQSYTITYTYGSNCTNTITANVNITNNCANNVGVVNYISTYGGGTSTNVASVGTVSTTTCPVSIDYNNLIFAGGTSDNVASVGTVSTTTCPVNIDIPNLIFAGGLSNNVLSVGFLPTTTCPVNIDFSTLLYAGGLSNNVVSSNALQLKACPYPVGDNFYLGGTGGGYGFNLVTPTTGSVTGTSVAVSADQTICPGSPITLTATGATNFTWSPATNLSSTIIANPVANPMTTTTYTVVGTGGVGCINTAKVKVTVLEDNYTSVSYGAYNFDETDMNLKKVNYIVGPLTGTFSASPSGLFFDQNSGSFTPGLSTSGVYVINYNYTKGSCNYTFVSNINITTLPPSITYPSPSIFYINYAGITATPANTGGRAIAYEALDALPSGLTINTTTGTITGTPTALVENASVRVRAYNLNKSGGINYSDVYTMSISVRKPIISSTTSSIASLNTTYGIASTTRTVNVSGQYIIQNILVTPPNGFEVSSNASSGFGNTLTINASSGNIASTNAYIRLKTSAGVGNFSGTVNLTSDAADMVSIPVATSYVAAGPLTVTASYFQKFYGSKITLGAGSTNFNSVGLVNGETIGSVTLSATGGKDANDAPGLYNVTPSFAFDGTFSPANYNIVYVPGQFEVLYSLYNFAMTGSTSNWVLGKVPAPKISAGVISNLSYTTATYTSNISSSFSSIVERGACWNIAINPTTSNSKVIDGATTTGVMTSNLTGLTNGTTYFVRTYIKIGSYTYYGPNVKFKTPARDGLTAATASESGMQLHTDYPAYASGWYWIKSASMPNALQMYVDMVQDGGGYDFYFITTGPSVSTVTATNGGTALGLDLVMPRSKNHWKAMSNTVLQAISENKAGGASYVSYFQTAYGVYRTTDAGNGGGNYTSKVMRHSSYGGSTNASDWRVKDGGKWWLRDNAYGEPNGDYGLNGLLGGGGLPNPYNLTDIDFNDLWSNYQTGLYYLVSTNAKQ